MFLSHRNFILTLNNQNIFVNSADLSSQATITPVFLQNDRSSSQYVATDIINGSLKINYYLTGQAFLKDFIRNEKNIISGNIGGLTFASGYLKSYSLSCNPNNVVTPNVEIVFFEELGGNFNSSTPTIGENPIPFNFSNMGIDNLTGYSAFTFSNILSLNYNYSNDIKPVYFINSGINIRSISPEYVAFGPKSITCDIVTDILTGDLTLDGQNAGIKINFTSPLTNNFETFTISGVYFQKVLSNSVNNFVKNTVSIRQDNLYEAPVVSGIYPTNPFPGDLVVISGNNFTTTTQVKFNDERDDTFLGVNDSTILSHMPLNATTGLIYVKNYGGESYSPSNYALQYRPISITGISPITGKAGSKIFIYGDNFYRLTSVNFSGWATGAFQKINSKILSATVPDTGVWSAISVISSGRNLTGISTQQFVPFPRIDSINPTSGISGVRVDITGYNLNVITGISFGGIQTTGFSTNSNSGITTYVPSGNIRDYLNFYGQSGVFARSTFIFQPVVQILGIDPSSGVVGSTMRISGKYIYDFLLHSGITVSGVMINFNGGYTGFYLGPSNSGIVPPNFTGVLTGIIPSFANSGKVYLVQPDGAAMYPSDFIYNKAFSPPVVTSVIPNYATSGQLLNFSIQGQNLVGINLVRFTGILTNNRNSSLDITSTNFYPDMLGLKLNLLNVNIGSLPKPPFTGLYDILVSGTYGQGWAGFGYRMHVITGV